MAKGIDTPFQATAPYTDNEIMTDYSRDATGANTPNTRPQPPSTDPSAPTALNLANISADQNHASLVAALEAPLDGVKIVIIHVKDTFTDGPLVGNQILKELQDGEKEMQKAGKGLGCVFEISKSGGSYWFWKKKMQETGKKR
jgi:hypothetical protein